MGSALPQLHRYGIAAIVNTAALPLPQALRLLPRLRWDVGAGRRHGRRTCPCREARHVLSRSPPTRSAGYYAGQFLISALRDLNGTPYPICAHCTLCGPVVCTRDTVL
jgi:hypothetical protein